MPKQAVKQPLVTPRAIANEIRKRVEIIHTSLTTAKHEPRERAALLVSKRVLEVLLQDILHDLADHTMTRLNPNRLPRHDEWQVMVLWANGDRNLLTRRFRSHRLAYMVAYDWREVALVRDAYVVQAKPVTTFAEEQAKADAKHDAMMADLADESDESYMAGDDPVTGESI